MNGDPSYPIASGFVTFVAVALFLAMLGVWGQIISGFVQ
jgi:hypothetical protein